MISIISITLVLLLSLINQAHADTYEIAMSDGTLLHTEVDLPPFHDPTKKITAVLERSPYGANAEELIADIFGEVLGYASVRQDFRGTKQSGGEFEIWHDSAGDAYDTIEWITKQPWSNGIVFTTGASADAIDELAQLPSPHPSLRGQVIIFATSTGYETFYPGGAYRESLVDGWLHDTVPNAYARADKIVRDHEAPGSEWWNAVNGSLYWDHVTWPSISWAGWYDIFQEGNLVQYEGFQTKSSSKGLHRLVVDPCGHCQAAANLFPANTTFGRVLLPILMAFDMMSNDDPQNKTWPPVPEGVKNITMFVMGDDENGAPGNYWTTIEEMPVPTPTKYYLNPGGVLSSLPSSGSFSLSYIYDPANPVQTIGGNNLLIPCGPLDQRPIEKEKRQDVLIFTTPVLTEPVALAGLLQSTIFFSTNVTDTDIVVKLIDVYPASDPKDPLLAGESILVADGISRARWRNFPYSNDPAPLSGNPSDTYEVNISLWSTAYVFAAGHSIRVHVSSSNYPRFFPNSNTGTPMNATQGIANITASTTIYLGSGGNSHFTFPVVDLASLPGFPVEEAVTSMLSRYEESWTANVRSREAGDVDLRTWLLRRLSKAWDAMTKAA